MKLRNILSSTKMLSIAILLLIVGSISSCEKKEIPDLTEEQVRQINLTTSAWRLERVTVDGMNQTDIYRDLQLNFSASSYTSTNGRVIWPETGTWEFTDETNTVIRRDDGLLVTIQVVTSNSLILALTWESGSITTGRIAAVSGNHIFEFGR
ncbi:hypothetical protein [Belliella buryatensis]|nr:hypothetical protein [Belliella buryatensis]